MIVDEIFLLYENSDKHFPTYEQAYFNSRKPGASKQVYYVFTPTMQRFKRVCEVENAYRQYFNNHFDCDFFDINSGFRSKQLKIIGEV